MNVATDPPTTSEGLIDRSLPHLAAALDVNYVRQLWQDVIARSATDLLGASNDIEVGTGTIMWIKYRPHEHCRIAYQFDIHHPGAPVYRQIVHGRMYEQSRLESFFHDAASRKLVPSRFGPPINWLRELDMVMWSFPNDRKLLQLSNMANPSWYRDQMYINCGGGRAGAVGKVTEAEIVHYVPEQACTVRLTVDHGGNRYAKGYVTDDGAYTYRIMNELSEEYRVANRFLRLTRPLAYWPEARILIQTAATGIPVSLLKRDSTRWLQSLRLSAAALRSFHSIPAPPTARATDESTWTDRLSRSLQLVAKIGGSHFDRLQPVVERLLAIQPAVSVDQTTTIHGDLHPRNLLVDDDSVAIIDLDNVQRGEVSNDIGSFLAGLLYLGRRWGHTPLQIRDSVSIFLSVYARHDGNKTETHVLGWYVAASLIAERIYRCITGNPQFSPSLLSELISAAHRLAGGSGQQAGPFSAAIDAIMWPQPCFRERTSI